MPLKLKKNNLVILLIFYITTLEAQQLPVISNPSLLVNASQIIEIRKGIKDSTLKLASWRMLKFNADRFLKEQLEIPSSVVIN